MNVLKTTLLTSLLVLSASTNAALVSRLGGLAYYDTEANLTWLADANNAQPIDGNLSLVDANSWTANLSVAGVTGWRLPTGAASCIADIQCYASELGNLYYNTLGNSLNPFSSAIGNPGPFSNIVGAGAYWLAPEDPTDEVYASFIMSRGLGGSFIPTPISRHYAWAVYTGDVGQVPLPGAIWLLGSALLGLGILKRRPHSRRA